MVEEDGRKLVLARLENMPPNMKLSIGGQGSLSKQDLINHVKAGDEIGEKFVKIQLTYLRAIAKKYA